MTTPPGGNRAKDVFQAIIGRPAGEPAVYLRDVCGEDSSLQAEVASLLAAHDQVGSFAERSAIHELEDDPFQMKLAAPIVQQVAGSGLRGRPPV